MSKILANRQGKVIASDGKLFSIQTGGITPQSYEWQQTSEAVQSYIREVDYSDDPFYTTSEINNYATSTVVPSASLPIGVSVDTISGEKVKRNGYAVDTDSQTGNTVIYNDIPQTATDYIVSSENEIKSVGTVKPLHFLRQIKIDGLANVRDLGGWACDGGTVKYGKLYRGGEMYVYSAQGIDVFLNQIGVKAELDLQGTDGSDPHMLSDHVDYCCPIKEGNNSWAQYTLANTEQMKEAFRFIFDSVKKNKPLYFHCAMGADRTGTIACIIESLLGMSQSDVDKDYELTSFAYATSHRTRTSSGWVSLQSQINALSGETRQEKVANWLGTMGFTEQEINAFRARMINGIPTIIHLSIGTYDIDTSGVSENVTFDNSSTSGTKYQPYIAHVSANNGFVIDSVHIIEDGIDRTQKYWNGTKTTLNRNVFYNLDHCRSIPSNQSVMDGQMFYANIVADSGYTVIGAAASVTMSGVDVTSQSYSNGRVQIQNVTGDIVISISAVEIAPGTLTVTNILANCTTSNEQNVITAGQPYSAKITANAGYTLVGAQITILMGGIDVSEFYSDGIINIPNVSGNLEIRITAVSSARINYFDKTDPDLHDHGRINSKGEAVDYAVSQYYNQLVTGFIPITVGDVITLITDENTKTYSSYSGVIAFYDQNKVFTTMIYGNEPDWTWNDDGKTGSIRVSDHFESVDLSNATYCRLCIAYSADYTSNDNIKIFKD